jgi:hypothetical protein
MSYGPYGQPPQPPKKGMSTGAKIGIGCGGCLGISILGFVFILVLGAVVGSDSDTSDTTVAVSPEAAAESGTPEEVAAEEEPAEEASGVTMTASHAGTVGDVTGDGTVYTALDIEVVNDSEESIEVNPIYFSAELADGTVVSDWSNAIFADIDQIDTVTLQPGQRASGQIALVGEVDVAQVTMAELFGLEDPVTAAVE